MLSVFAGLSHHEGHCIFAGIGRGRLEGRAVDRENAMSELTYVVETHPKTSLRPSSRAIKRAALALAVALGVAAAADLGVGYVTTGRYLVSTDDAYVKAD